MNEGNKISLILTLDLAEVNLILDALGDRPFREVFELITHINLQANEQLTQKTDIEDNPTTEH